MTSNSIIFSSKRHLDLCRGCWLCLSKGEDQCPLDDDREKIERQILAANGIIFVTPVYALNVSALMKNFLDRFAYTLHRPRFYEQHAMIVSTAGAVGLKETIDRMTVIKLAGFNLVHTAGFVTPPNLVSRKAKERIGKGTEKAARKLYEAMETKRSLSPGFTNLIAFRGQQAAFQLSHDYNISECDYNYFKDYGRFDKQ